MTELKDAITDTYINDALTTVTLQDEYGEEVAGQVWPLVMDYVVGSNGTYRGNLVSALVLIANKKYKAFVTTTASGSTGTWTCNVVSRIRDCCDGVDCSC